MLKRAATVIWWLGCVGLLFGWIGTVASVFNDRADPLVLGISGTVFATVLWSIAFVLGGSFLRPATGPLSLRG